MRNSSACAAKKRARATTKACFARWCCLPVFDTRVYRFKTEVTKPCLFRRSSWLPGSDLRDPTPYLPAEQRNHIARDVITRDRAQKRCLQCECGCPQRKRVTNNATTLPAVRSHLIERKNGARSAKAVARNANALRTAQTHCPRCDRTMIECKNAARSAKMPPATQKTLTATQTRCEQRKHVARNIIHSFAQSKTISVFVTLGFMLPTQVFPAEGKVKMSKYGIT